MITFPSPVGELHFSIHSPQGGADQEGKFPSPVGELHFSMRNVSLQTYLVKSFRPLSGNYISQYRLAISRFYCFVSVPCRGTTFLNTTQIIDRMAVCSVSVPCRGTTFLNMARIGRGEDYIVSVPCRGTTFLNK